VLVAPRRPARLAGHPSIVLENSFYSKNAIVDDAVLLCDPLPAKSEYPHSVSFAVKAAETTVSVP
jgi:hypothetical protein